MMDLTDIPDILKKITATKTEEVAAIQHRLPELREKAAEQLTALDFPAALQQRGLSVIAEIKKASPSAGDIVTDFDPVRIARAYSANASAVSVLTDRQYFKGDAEYIPQVRPELPGVPILRKDFIIDPVQIYEARALGADTFLLISAILSTQQLQEYLELGRSLGMEALVESHDELELARAIEAGSRVFGINNRDLRRFVVDLATSERLIAQIPQGCVKVAESGIHNVEDAGRMADAGYDAVLVGESLMRSGIESCGKCIEQFVRCGV